MKTSTRHGGLSISTYVGYSFTPPYRSGLLPYHRLHHTPRALLRRGGAVGVSRSERGPVLLTVDTWVSVYRPKDVNPTTTLDLDLRGPDHRSRHPPHQLRPEIGSPLSHSLDTDDGDFPYQISLLWREGCPVLVLYLCVHVSFDNRK